MLSTLRVASPCTVAPTRRLLALARHLNRARGDGSAPQGHHIVHSAALSSMAESSSAAAAAAAAKQKAAGAAALHPSPSAQQLSQLTHILNARDMAEASRKLKPGRLFRSGSPAHAELEDVLLLRRELGVRHMLDFRSADEHQEDTAWSLMLSNGVIKTYDTAGSVTSVSVDHNAALHGVDLEDVQLHRISLMDRRRVMRGMMSKLPLSSLLWAGWYKLWGDDSSMRDTLMPEINRGGLLLIYKILLDTAQADLAKSLQLITASLEQRQPCMFFCKLGKDRTGLMAALVLSACGCSEEEILDDYVRSDGVHEVALGGIEKHQDLKGMDQAVFAAAPREAMAGLLQYCKERYGGMRQYMEYCGFSRQQQDSLRRCLTDGDW